MRWWWPNIFSYLLHLRLLAFTRRSRLLLFVFLRRRYSCTHDHCVVMRCLSSEVDNFHHFIKRNVQIFWYFKKISYHLAELLEKRQSVFSECGDHGGYLHHHL